MHIALNLFFIALATIGACVLIHGVFVGLARLFHWNRITGEGYPLSGTSVSGLSTHILPDPVDQVGGEPSEGASFHENLNRAGRPNDHA